MPQEEIHEDSWALMLDETILFLPRLSVMVMVPWKVDNTAWYLQQSFNFSVSAPLDTKTKKSDKVHLSLFLNSLIYFSIENILARLLFL